MNAPLVPEGDLPLSSTTTTTTARSPTLTSSLSTTSSSAQPSSLSSLSTASAPDNGDDPPPQTRSPPRSFASPPNDAPGGEETTSSPLLTTTTTAATIVTTTDPASSTSLLSVGNQRSSADLQADLAKEEEGEDDEEGRESGPSQEPQGNEEDPDFGGQQFEMNSMRSHFNPFAEVFTTPEAVQFRKDILAIILGWTQEDKAAGRKLVHFWLEPRTTNTFRCSLTKPVGVSRSVVVSCIYWSKVDDYFFTSVDSILLFECLGQVNYNSEEKNRIRRNLEGFQPISLSRNKMLHPDFFDTIMEFPKPKPRTIEKDIKVFYWKILSLAVIKVASRFGKYSTIDHGHQRMPLSSMFSPDPREQFEVPDSLKKRTAREELSPHESPPKRQTRQTTKRLTFHLFSPEIEPPSGNAATACSSAQKDSPSRSPSSAQKDSPSRSPSSGDTEAKSQQTSTTRHTRTQIQVLQTQGELSATSQLAQRRVFLDYVSAQRSAHPFSHPSPHPNSPQKLSSAPIPASSFLPVIPHMTAQPLPSLALQFPDPSLILLHQQPQQQQQQWYPGPAPVYAPSPFGAGLIPGFSAFGMPRMASYPLVGWPSIPATAATATSQIPVTPMAPQTVLQPKPLPQLFSHPFLPQQPRPPGNSP